MLQNLLARHTFVPQASEVTERAGRVEEATLTAPSSSARDVQAEGKRVCVCPNPASGSVFGHLLTPLPAPYTLQQSFLMRPTFPLFSQSFLCCLEKSALSP